MSSLSSRTNHETGSPTLQPEAPSAALSRRGTKKKTSLLREKGRKELRTYSLRDGKRRVRRGDIFRKKETTTSSRSNKKNGKQPLDLAKDVDRGRGPIAASRTQPREKERSRPP